MWVIKGLLFLALLFVLVYFFVTNSNQSVDLKFFGQHFLGISIYWVVVVSFMVGFATSFLLAALREFKFHRRIAQLQKDGQAKDREIADLRTLPLRNDAPPTELKANKEQAGD